MLASQVEPGLAVDWLHWLANGRTVLRNRLTDVQRKRVYESFADYWDRAVKQKPADVQAELSARPAEANLGGELSRIYREEVGRPKQPAFD